MAKQKKQKGTKQPEEPKHPDEPNEPYPEGERPKQIDHDVDKEKGHEPYDDPEEHLEIERRRFHGGLPPTSELYARAREQWNRLPGSLVRPPMDPVIGESGADEQQPQELPDEKRGEI